LSSSNKVLPAQRLGVLSESCPNGVGFPPEYSAVANPSDEKRICETRKLLPENVENVRSAANSILGANQKHRDAMFSLIASQEAIAFVGAGFSAELHPPWKTLLQKLRAEADKVGKFAPSTGLTEDNPLLFADEIQRHFKRNDGDLNRYYQILGQQFTLTERGCTSNHENLVCLPFKGFITTNYDQSLETALIRRGNKRPDCAVVVKKNNKDAHKVSEFLFSLDDRKQSQRVAHLHGLENETEEIILSASDYQQAYGFREATNGDATVPIQNDWTLHRKIVWALLATRRVIFFGFSFTDPYVNQILRDVTADLWSKGEGRHFALAPLDRTIIDAAETKQREFLEYGVQIVFYDNLGTKHVELAKLIGEAVERFGDLAFPKFRKLSRERLDVTPLILSDKKDIRSRCIDLLQCFRGRIVRRKAQADLNWLEEVNSETEGDLQKP
jgi:SIR2-like domain